MTPPSNGELPEDAIARQSDATFHRERPLAHPHLRVGETTEARQQSAGRHLHQGGCHGEGVCAGQPDRRRDGAGHGVHGRRQGRPAGGSGGPSASGRAERGAPPPAFRREDYIAPAGTAPGKIPVLPPQDRQAAGTEEEAGASRRRRRRRRRRRSRRAKIEEAAQPRRRARPSRPLPCRRKSRATKAERREGEGEREDRGKEERDRARRSSWPRCRRAKLPLRPKSAEPAPQKPDIKLPQTPSAPARRAPSRFPSTSASTSRSGRPRKPPRPRPARQGRRPRNCRRSSAAADGRERPRRGGRSAPPLKKRTRTGRRPSAAASSGNSNARRPPPSGGESRKTTKRRPPRPSRRRTHIRRTGANTAAPRRENVSVELPCTVRSFSEAIGVPARDHPGQAAGTGHDEQHRRHAGRRDGRTVGGASWACRSTSIAPWTRSKGPPSAGSRRTTRRSSSRGRPSSRSSATSTTARRRCWTGSSASTWPRTRRAASPSTSAPIA